LVYHFWLISVSKYAIITGMLARKPISLQGMG